MISNYYTLRHVVADLRVRWTGRVITSFFSQEKNELAVTAAGEDTLLVSCEPSNNSVYLRSGYSRAKKNTIDLFAKAAGRVLRSVSIHPSDREISLGLDDDLQVVLQLYGSRANVYLVDAGRTVLESFLRPKESIGKVLDAQAGAPSLPDSPEEFASLLRSTAPVPVPTALRRMNPLLGGLLVRELLFCANINEQVSVPELDRETMLKLYSEWQSLLEKLSAPPLPSIYYKGQHPSAFAIVRLRHLEQSRIETFESIHKGIQTFLSSARRERHLLDEREWVMEKLTKEEEKIERTLNKIRSETAAADQADRYELSGKLLMAALHQVSKGMNSIVLENGFSDEREAVEIPLDVHLTPVRNAERYFDKARKARHSIAEQRERMTDMTQRLTRLKGLLAEIGRIESIDEWKEFASAHARELKDAGVIVKGGAVKEEEKIPFRVFTVDGGFQVWAGKSSENNDLLTLKYARPNDLWFHARGAGGSHVVLRLGTGKGEISKRAIEQAAGIAAYYSKMKKAGLVPVAMTERKYVRKPRGAPAGTVAVEREKVLMVPPRLPEGHSQ